MATISEIEDFRAQFEMFAFYSLLLAVCTNNANSELRIKT